MRPNDTDSASVHPALVSQGRSRLVANTSKADSSEICALKSIGSGSLAVFVKARIWQSYASCFALHVRRGFAAPLHSAVVSHVGPPPVSTASVEENSQPETAAATN